MSKFITKKALAIFAVAAIAAAIIITSVFTLRVKNENASPKLPTTQTVKCNEGFGDENYFSGLEKEWKNAEYGLIDKGDGQIKTLTDPPQVIFDMEKQYDFLTREENKGSVNPSLWEHAKLNYNYGLYKVTDGIYQVRGYGIANVTFVETDNGWFVMDVAPSIECGQAALELVEKNLGKRPIYAISYSHSHTDHYGGVRAFVKDEDIANGTVKIFAPDGFMEAVARENIYAGTAMGRRAVYQFSAGNMGMHGALDSGLGKSIYGYNVTLMPPTDVVKQDGSVVVDGLEVYFQLTPGTEASAEMNTFIPKYNTLFGAENVTGTLHNVYTIRGAEIRDALGWSKFIDEAINLWPDMNVICSSHNWPQLGNQDSITYLENHRDIYRYIHDATLNLLNKGYTINEVGRLVKLPPALEKEWTTHGYYGTVSHNARAVAQKYLGFYDANPSTLNPPLPEDSAAKFVEYMGGSAKILKRAKEDYAAGNYAWVAEVLNRLIFAEPDNVEARYLCADALEQMGYQAESAIWRNSYIQGAGELRNGVEPSTYKVASADAVNALSVDMILDYMAIKFDGFKRQDVNMTMNVILSDTGERAHVVVKNSVVNYRIVKKEETLDGADVTITATKFKFNELVETKDITIDGLTVEGNPERLTNFLDYLDDFTQDFNIVTP